MKTSCITGVNGQSGSYLAERLLSEGHKVYGLIRKSSTFNTERIEHIFNDPNLELVYGDLSDSGSINNFVKTAKPDYFFNLGAMSHVKVSFDQPSYVLSVDAGGVINCLEAIRINSPNTRFLQASTSELFGSSPPPQNELTPFHPRSPYGVAKLAAYWGVINYREAYNMFSVNSLSFNHESKRRSPTFVSRKITRAATRIKLGLQDKLHLGNLEAKRDWSHASDIVDGMIKIINASEPDDYVIASGEMHSVREFAEIVFGKLDMDYQDYVEFDPKYLRPAEVDALMGDASKIRNKLGWEPKYTFMQLVNEMVEHDLKLAQQEKLLRDNQ